VGFAVDVGQLDWVRTEVPWGWEVASSAASSS
jgi:hypothetical protein